MGHRSRPRRSEAIPRLKKVMARDLVVHDNIELLPQ